MSHVTSTGHKPHSSKPNDFWAVSLRNARLPTPSMKKWNKMNAGTVCFVCNSNCTWQVHQPSMFTGLHIPQFMCSDCFSLWLFGCSNMGSYEKSFQLRFSWGRIECYVPSADRYHTAKPTPNPDTEDRGAPQDWKVPKMQAVLSQCFTPSGVIR